MKWMNGWTDEWMNGWMDEWMSGWMDEWMNGWMDEWMNGWMDEWMTGWMDEWMNGWMDEWMNEWMNQWLNQGLNGWINERTNEWISEWVSERASEWGSEWMNGYIPKVLWPWQFFEHVQVEIELSLRATVWCTFCRSLSPIEPRNRRNRDPTSATKDGHFTQKNTGFRAPEFTRSRPVTLPNYVMMMMMTMM